MINSLRGLGYSLETAVADILDNSIAAGAQNIAIGLEWNSGDPIATFLDDGTGIAPERMLEALRFGAGGPHTDRAASDLGRFGLGLKTASLAQCRRVSVASNRNGEHRVMTWDVDHIESAGGRWEILEDEYSGPASALKELNSRESGALVVWEKVDFGRGEDKPERAAFLRELEQLHRHLAMIFHRFLNGDARTIAISLNGASVTGWDPFLTDHEATIPSPEQPLRAPGGAIRVQGFVLPHRDRFRTERAFEEAGGPDGWNSQQGFYVYRAKRLLINGGWLGLGRGRAWTRDEPSRLARIRVDIPNTADRDWRIDVRKSRARPPDAVRSELQRIAKDVRDRARAVFVHRGGYGPRAKPVASRIWDVTTSGGGNRYFIMRDHALVSLVRERLGADGEMLDGLLELIQRTVPVERVWLDVTEHGAPLRLEDLPGGHSELIDQAATLAQTFRKAGVSIENALATVSAMDPFDRVPDMAAQLNRRFQHPGRGK